MRRKFLPKLLSLAIFGWLLSSSATIQAERLLVVGGIDFPPPLILLPGGELLTSQELHMALLTTPHQEGDLLVQDLEKHTAFLYSSITSQFINDYPLDLVYLATSSSLSFSPANELLPANTSYTTFLTIPGNMLYVSSEMISLGQGGQQSEVSDLDQDTIADIDDCDPQDPSVLDYIIWYPDIDADGYGGDSKFASRQACDVTVLPGYVESVGLGLDCDDFDSAEHPDQIWYLDADDDGYSTGATNTTSCERPSGYKIESELLAPDIDCNDTDASINPGATEVIGDGNDQDCDTQEQCYTDLDDDGYIPDYSNTVTSVDLDCTDTTEATSSDAVGDCNDADPTIHPGAIEECDGIDNNCDSDIDEGVTLTWYLDNDEDTYGDPSTGVSACIQPDGYISESTDCNDLDPMEHPNQTWYKDEDGDGYSDGTTITDSCLRPADYYVASELKAISGDPDDTDPYITPSRFPWTIILPAILKNIQE